MMDQYYFFYLEIALKDKNDLNIYAQVNISHIPTSKLIEIFNINPEKDPHILNGYFLTKSSYRKHKKYIQQHLGQMNFDLFEYSLMQYVSSDMKSIRALYKVDLME